MWTKKDDGTGITQPQAANYCRALNLQSFRDWRLPTIDQLAGLFDASESRADPYFVKSGIELTASPPTIWSSSQGVEGGTAWLVNFGVTLLSLDNPAAPVASRARPARGRAWNRVAEGVRALCVRRDRK